MSFTADELQSFNDILEKKLSAHRQEMERVFDQRIQTLRREMEQRLMRTQQEILHSLNQKMTEQQKSLQDALSQKLNAQQMGNIQAVGFEIKQRQQQIQPLLEGLIDSALAAQLLAIEELLNQRLALQPLANTEQQFGERNPPFEAIEVQTDLPWEDLAYIFGKVLDERLAKLDESTQAMMKNWEHYLSAQLHTLHSQVHDEIMQIRQPQVSTGNLTSMQEVFQSIEQLERIIESMQVAMTANHALLSNRLYHHLQFPSERAHADDPTPTIQVSHPNGTSTNNPRFLDGE